MNVYCEDRWNRCLGWNGGASVNEEKENSAAIKRKTTFGSSQIPMNCQNVCIQCTICSNSTSGSRLKLRISLISETPLSKPEACSPNDLPELCMNNSYLSMDFSWYHGHITSESKNGGWRGPWTSKDDSSRSTGPMDHLTRFDVSFL